MKTGKSLTESQTDRLLSSIDFNNDGCIDYREFLIIVIRRIISANAYKWLTFYITAALYTISWIYKIIWFLAKIVRIKRHRFSEQFGLCVSVLDLLYINAP